MIRPKWKRTQIQQDQVLTPSLKPLSVMTVRHGDEQYRCGSSYKVVSRDSIEWEHVLATASANPLSVERYNSSSTPWTFFLFTQTHPHMRVIHFSRLCGFVGCSTKAKCCVHKYHHPAVHTKSQTQRKPECLGAFVSTLLIPWVLFYLCLGIQRRQNPNKGVIS